MLINSLNEIKDNELLIEGLNLIIKKLSKIYPFVIGWEFDEDYLKYKTTLFLNLIIDYDKLIQFYPELKMSSHIKRYIRDLGQYKSYNFKTNISSESQNLDFGDKEKIDSLINNSYNKLYRSESNYVAEVVWFDNFTDKVTLRVNAFIIKSDNILDDEENLPF